jgi:hypothetical protein
MNYYRLHDGHVTLHLTRSQLKALQTKISRTLAKRERGHREYHVNVLLKARFWRKLSVTSHAAHRRHCAAQAEAGQAARGWVRD